MANTPTQDDAVAAGKVDKAATGTPTLLKSNAAFNVVTLTTAVAQQLSTDHIIGLYIAVTTSTALSISIGPDATTAIALCPSQTFPLGLTFIRIPVGWYVKLTGTLSNVITTQVKNT
jgi:hypothetical protein